jgi:nitric oxide reductase NorQ protein
VTTPTSPGVLHAITAQPAHALAPPPDEPFYLASGDEAAIFERCHALRLAVMLKGPTGCGKTRFVEHMAWHLKRPLLTISCHDDLTASDLVGRFLIRHDGTVWQDGPLTRAVREGAICYLDEVVEARQDTMVVLHSLTDHRRILPIDKTGETITAAPGFQLVVSYNPGYQRMLKDLKPSTRQRFVALDFDFPPAQREAAIIEREAGAEHATAVALVSLGQRLRALRDRGLAEVPSTRLLIAAAALVASGVSMRQACYAAVVSPLSDDESLVGAMRDLVDATFV